MENHKLETFLREELKAKESNILIWINFNSY